MSLSNYLENEMGDHIFGAGNRDYTAPTTLFIGLSTTNPGEAGAGITEPISAGNGYARIPCTDTDWAVASGGIIVNSSNLQFSQAQSDWSIHSYAFISDQGSSGNLMMYGTLTSSKDISQGDTLVFSGGDISFSLD